MRLVSTNEPGVIAEVTADAYSQMIETVKREIQEGKALNAEVLQALTDSTQAMKQVALTLANIPRVFAPLDRLIKTNEALIARAKAQA